MDGVTLSRALRSEESFAVGRLKLKQHFQPELNHSRPRKLTGDGAKGGAIRGCIRRRKLRMVHGVDCFGAELQLDALRQASVLNHRKIPVVGAIGSNAVK